MSQAKTYIKSGKDYDKAEKLMTDLLEKDSASRHEPKVYLTLYTALQKQYETGNEKLYLKEKYDTTTLFTLTKKIYTTLEALDSVDTKYRKKHAEELHTLRPNLYSAGQYYMKKGDYEKAYPYFEMFLDTRQQPIFTGYDYATTDSTKNINAACHITLCGAKMSNPELTLRHADEALQDTARRPFILMHIARAQQQQGNDTLFINTLRHGFHEKPQFHFFFAELMDYYTAHGSTAEALGLTKEAIDIDPRSPLFLLARATTLYNAGKEEECIPVADSLIAITDTIPLPYYYAGMAHFNKKDYNTAKSYMEKYRERAPQDKQRWAFPLYTIYLNLNDGKKFDEIDKIMKQNN